MLNRRLHLHGFFAVLLALMAQLGIGASVPRINPVVAAGAPCHTEDDTGGTPSQTPSHPTDCLVCPLCIALNAPSATLAPTIATPMPLAGAVVLRTELPPPSTAPPAPHRPPSQPRAPPIFS